MKKLFVLLLFVVLSLNLIACEAETVMLQCDGENCENTVEVEAEDDNVPDESWVVFCKDCADNVLHD